jgi:dephospho-CoA kinase
MLTIGVMGGIGSGKSTVTAMLAELGAPVIDADKVGHAIYAPDGPAYPDMIAAFGEGILADNRTIDRKKLGPIVFADPAALKRLNAIVHPKMFARMREMIEANWQPLFNEIWLVVASRERVIERVERDRGLNPEQTEARIKAQLSDDERRKHATLVINNDGSLEALRAQVTEIWQGVLARNSQSGAGA